MKKLTSIIPRLFALIGFFAFMLSTGVNTSCQEYCPKGEKGCPGYVEPDPAYYSYFDSDGDGDNDLCNVEPDEYGVSAPEQWLYVSPTGDNTTGADPETAFTTIQAAIDYRADPTKFTTATVAIYLANDTTFEESIVLDSSSHSNTIFVGCTNTATLAPTPNSTTAFTATTHAIQVAINAEAVGVYNLTIKGIGYNYNTSKTPDGDGCTDENAATTCPYTETSTVYLNNAKGFTLQDVTIENNYYLSVLVSGSMAYGSITDTTLSDFDAGAGATDGTYDDRIGIRVSGSTTTATAISGLILSDETEFGVVVLDGYTTLSDSEISNVTADAVFLYMSDGGTQPTADISTTTFTNNFAAVYAKDTASLHLATDIAASNSYGLISCQYESTDTADSVNTLSTGVLESINYFDTVTVDGSGASISGTCSYYNTTMSSYSGSCTEVTTRPYCAR